MKAIQTKLDTEYGAFNVSYWKTGGQEGVLLWTDNIQDIRNPLVRLHSSCLFSESFASLDCDCNLQLQESLKLINREGGAIAYLYQEGRGQGMEKKIQAMEVQRTQELDTHDAFQLLGFELDPRDYSAAIASLRGLGLSNEIRLISNNPRKSKQLADAGFVVIENAKLELNISPAVREYLQVKQDKLDHDIGL